MKTEQKHINRGEFMRELGLSSAALMAFYCLEGCSKASNDPAPATTNTTPTTGTPAATGLTGNSETAKGKIDFVLDLSVTANEKLKTEGEYAVVGDVFIALAKGKKYIALSKACTHEGNPLKYRLNSDDILCDTHGSQFNTDGSVKVSPATKSLTKYSAILDGTKLSIKE